MQRFDGPDGSKRYLPYDPNTQTYKTPKLRPLYNLPAFMSSSTIILVEGEKCADALISQGLVASTAMNGSKAPLDKTDWTAFIDKNVIIWPDNDDTGKDYAQRVAKLLCETGARRVAILDVPSDMPPKWDVADAIAEGWTPMKLEAFIRQQCCPYESDEELAENKQSPILPPCLTEQTITLDDFLTRYVYVAEGDRVCDLLSPAHCSLYKLSEFKNLTANCLQEVPAPTKSNPTKTKLDVIWRQWLAHPQRKNARGACYQPGEDQLFKDEHGLHWINEFHLPKFKTINDESWLDLFFDHMHFLFPIEKEYEWFIDWMAFSLQHPERRCKVTPLHVSVAQGTGRGWIVNLMEKLLGRWNCKKTKMHVLCAENTQYHEYLHNSLFCAVEEAKDSDKRYTVADSIRDLLTEDTLEINLKYGFKRTQPVMTNFFFMSSHPDALVLTTEDRRINVFRGPDQHRSDKYYKQLYSWLDTDGVSQLYHYLMRRDIQQFNWQRAMDNEAKQEMIENNRTQTELLFLDFVKSAPSPIMTLKQIKRFICQQSEDGVYDTQVDERQLIKLLQGHCRRCKPVKIRGRYLRPWILDPSRQFETDEIRAHLSNEVINGYWSNPYREAKE